MSDTLKKVLKLSALIIVSAFIGVMLGQFMSNYEMRFSFSRRYIGNYRGIDIYETGDINEENMRMHLQMLSDAPEELAECTDRLYFIGTDVALPVNDEELGDVLGLTQGSTVYISTSSFSAYVVFHELFHAYDSAHGDISENSREFREIYANAGHTVPVFAAYSSDYPAEFFAQAGAMCLVMPFEMSRAAPSVYEYYSELLEKKN